MRRRAAILSQAVSCRMQAANKKKAIQNRMLSDTDKRYVNANDYLFTNRLRVDDLTRIKAYSFCFQAISRTELYCQS